MRRRMRKQEEQQTQQEGAAAVSSRDERALPFDCRDAICIHSCMCLLFFLVVALVSRRLVR